MKFLVFFCFLFPVSISAQVVDEIYTKLFFYRPFGRVTYSEIKKFKIKCIKYTSNRLGASPLVDSLGNRIRGLNLITEIHYESFDSLGMMNGLSRKNCPNNDSTSKDSWYSNEVLYLLKNLKNILRDKSELAFHDSIAKCVILFDKKSNSITLKNYSDWYSNVAYTEFLNDKLEFEYPKFDKSAWTFFLNSEFELKKDSIVVEGVLGCEKFPLLSSYKYNSKGQVIEKVVANHYKETRIYNSQGDLSEVLTNGKLYAKYYYEKEKLLKIVFEGKVGLNLIEFEY
jgi:hypothetical protein